MRSFLRIALLTAVVGLPAVASALSWAPAHEEVSAGGVLFIPDDQHGLYNTGYGAEAQYRYWFTDDWGLALAAGVVRYNVKHDESDFAPGTAGTVDTVPLGASVLYEVYRDGAFRVIAEGGLRYLLVGADATALDSAGRRVDLHIENGLLGVLAANAEWALTKRLALCGSLGYQKDLGKQPINVVGEGDLKDNEFKGFVLQLGARVSF